MRRLKKFLSRYFALLLFLHFYREDFFHSFRTALLQHQKTREDTPSYRHWEDVPARKALFDRYKAVPPHFVMSTWGAYSNSWPVGFGFSLFSASIISALRSLLGLLQ